MNHSLTLILTILAVLIGLYLLNNNNNQNVYQVGGQDIISSNAILEGADLTDIDQVEADIQAENLGLVENAFIGDFRNADYTDNNLSRSDINTIINGPSYIASEQANMYFTGDVVDDIGNYTVDGSSRVPNQPQPRRIDSIIPGKSRYAQRRLGRIVEANNGFSMANYRPRTNDKAFRITRAGLRQVDVMQVYDFMGRTSFVLRFKGRLPTECNQLRILPVRMDPFGNIRVTIYSIVDPLLSCSAESGREWQIAIPLIRLPRGRYNVIVNNRPITGLVQN